MSAEALSLAIKRLAARESLDGPTITNAFDVIMRGEGSPAQVAALLMALRVKGETPVELAGVVESLRSAMITIAAHTPDQLVDTCGTGGGTLTTFNISTAAALVAAGIGVPIAKHGNRSFTSRSGSADVLEALEVMIDLSPEAMSQTLDVAGIVFMFAPLMHPALRHVGPVRRELGVPTVMNIVGPLANPARAGRQVVGVSEPERLTLLAEALQKLGTIRALVVHGAPGIDEVSPLGTTDVLEVHQGALTRWEIDPAITDIAGIEAADLAGGDPAQNAHLIDLLLRGDGPPAARAAVVLNSAAALYVSSGERDFGLAVREARNGLARGAGASALDNLRRAARQAALAHPRR